MGIIFKKDNKYGVVRYNVEEYKNDKGLPKANYLDYNIVVDAIYDDIKHIGNYYVLCKNNKVTLYNLENNKISDEYDSFERFQGIYIFEKDNKFGIFEQTEAIYDDICYEQISKNSSGSGHTTEVTRNQLSGMINGKKVLIKELEPTILCVD